jgi:hypothetical protein
MNRFVSHPMAIWTNSPTEVFKASYTCCACSGQT